MGKGCLHTCGKVDLCEATEKRRDVCSFCAAMAIHPEKRSTAMKIVIEGEELQLELLRLLKVAPYFGSMRDDKIELKVKIDVCGSIHFNLCMKVNGKIGWM